MSLLEPMDGWLRDFRSSREPRHAIRGRRRATAFIVRTRLSTVWVRRVPQEQVTGHLRRTGRGVVFFRDRDRLRRSIAERGCQFRSTAENLPVHDKTRS